MKRSLMVAAALAAFVVPAAAPLAVLAQEASGQNGERRGRGADEGRERRGDHQ